MILGYLLGFLFTSTGLIFSVVYGMQKNIVFSLIFVALFLFGIFLCILTEKVIFISKYIKNKKYEKKVDELDD